MLKLVIGISKKTGKEYYCLGVDSLSKDENYVRFIILTWDLSTILRVLDLSLREFMATYKVGEYYIRLEENGGVCVDCN